MCSYCLTYAEDWHDKVSAEHGAARAAVVVPAARVGEQLALPEFLDGLPGTARAEGQEVTR